MMSRSDLALVAQLLGFTTRQAEKDYIQHVFLHALYTVSTSEFVFKGGTALQKTHGLDRFSEDLDFTCSVDPDACHDLVTRAVSMIPDASVSKHQVTDVSTTVKVRIRGPLYDGKEISVQPVTVECSTREPVILEAKLARVVPRYRELRPYIPVVMEAREMLAEKVRAIMTRHKARDLYDTWFLIEKGVSCDLALVNGKLALYHRTFDAKAFHDAVQAKERSWDAELGALLREVPRSDEIVPGIERRVVAMLDRIL